MESIDFDEGDVTAANALQIATATAGPVIASLAMLVAWIAAF